MRSPAELNVVSESIRVRIPSPPLVQISDNVVNLESTRTLLIILAEYLPIKDIQPNQQA